MIIIIFYAIIVYFGVYAAPDNRPGAIIRPLHPVHQLFTVYQAYLWRAQVVLYGLYSQAIHPEINSCPSGPWVEREQAQHRLMMQSPCRLSPRWLEPGHLGNNGTSTVNRYTPEPMPGEQAPGRSCPLPPASAAPWSTIAQEGPTKSQNHPRDQQTNHLPALLNERGKNQQHLKKHLPLLSPANYLLYILLFIIFILLYNI